MSNIAYEELSYQRATHCIPEQELVARLRVAVMCVLPSVSQF